MVTFINRESFNHIKEDGNHRSKKYAQFKEHLTKKMIPSLQKIVGINNVIEIPAITAAEDFSYFQSKIPGFYFFLGGTPLEISESEAPSHHTPDFFGWQV